MLDIQTQERIIGDVIYHVQPLPAGKALVMSRRLVALIMPVLGESAAFAGRDKTATVTMADLVGMSRIVDGIIDGMDDAAVMYLYETLAPTTQAQYGGKKVSLEKCFDVHFQGRLLECFLWLKFCLEVNFGPLVARLLKEVEAAPVPAVAASAASGEASAPAKA